jgi:hypothetical protein
MLDHEHLLLKRFSARICMLNISCNCIFPYLSNPISSSLESIAPSCLQALRRMQAPRSLPYSITSIWGRKCNIVVADACTNADTDVSLSRIRL